tara:strand:+ start:550 stop:747 length:198 start_codon:yes stop_codon:yes gene_type:complete
MINRERPIINKCQDCGDTWTGFQRALCYKCAPPADSLKTSMEVINEVSRIMKKLNDKPMAIDEGK